MGYKGGEQLFGPMVRGPMYTKANSGPSQYAGRTTLSSGDTTVTVSTTAVNSDSLILFGVEANSNQSSGFASPVNVCSIKSGSHFSFTMADGVASVRNEIIMWQLVRTS